MKKIGLKKKKGASKDLDACEEKKYKYKTLMLQENGAKYRTLYNKKYENRKKWLRPNENEILSFIPGTILKIFVKEGAEIKENDEILAFEAMKMENIIRSEKQGRIKKVNVAVGESVPKGVVMIEME